jgi:Mg-chelatase subunit ChlD
MSSRRPSTIQCHDCGTRVVNLASHRINCEKSHRNRVKLSITKSKPGASPRSSDISIRLSTPLVQSLLAKQQAMDDSQDVVFLLDVSGSMKGVRLASAKEALLKLSSELDGFDRLSVITFDNEAFQKLKPRAMRILRHQNELPQLMERIFAGGSTALYDAIIAGLEQIRDKQRRTSMIVLTDGADNASKNSLQSALDLLEQYPGVSLNIIRIDGTGEDSFVYQKLSEASKVTGSYVAIEETEIVTQVTRVFRRVVKNQVLPD